MIRNNLAILLAQRGLKISKISTQTGISRSTLNAIYQNESQMIQLGTIDKLCHSLSITPCDFFSYLPIDFTLSINQGIIQLDYEEGFLGDNGGILYDSLDITIVGVFIEKEDKSYIEFTAKLSNERTSGTYFEFDIDVAEDDKETFLGFWNNKIPIDFQTDIKKEFDKLIKNYIEKNFPEYIKNNANTDDAYKHNAIVNLQSCDLEVKFTF